MKTKICLIKQPALLLCLIMIVTSCSKKDEKSSFFIPKELSGVSIGMTFSELKRIRPHLQMTEFVDGIKSPYYENVQLFSDKDFTIGYGFEKSSLNPFSSSLNSQPENESSKLKLISAVSHIDDPAPKYFSEILPNFLKDLLQQWGEPNKKIIRIETNEHGDFVAKKAGLLWGKGREKVYLEFIKSFEELEYRNQHAFSNRGSIFAFLVYDKTIDVEDILGVGRKDIIEDPTEVDEFFSQINLNKK